jgi:alpha-beta hydrolase superfamily lysophospholipase
MMRRARTVKPVLPAEIGQHDGLAFSLWRPSTGDGEAHGGVVILHGAGSRKENHHDFARAAVASGFAAIAFDQRGHGESDGTMGARVLTDVESMAALLRDRIGAPGLPLALRGSSMGGYFAILAAAPVGACAVVAICPASGEGLRRSLAEGRLGFEADRDALDAFLAAHDLEAAIDSLAAALLLLHAEGDEIVPIQHSRELAVRLHTPGSRLIAVPGGHHRSIQHDAELQAVSLRFIAQACAERPPDRARN